MVVLTSKLGTMVINLNNNNNTYHLNKIAIQLVIKHVDFVIHNSSLGVMSLE